MWPKFSATRMKTTGTINSKALLSKTGLWKVGDQAVIDGAVVNGSWKAVRWVSSLVRKVQTGFLYHYALAMILGVFALMSYFVWLNK